MSSFIQTASENSFVWRYINKLSDTAKLDLAASLLQSVAHKKPVMENKEWASMFCGAWKDDRTAETIIDDIRLSRTKNTEISL